jgi:hypothetical protein
VNFLHHSKYQVTVCVNGNEKSKLLVNAQLFCRRFDWPLASRYSATGQSKRRVKPTYPAAHSTGVSKIPRFHKDVPRSDFSNTRSVRKLKSPGSHLRVVNYYSERASAFIRWSSASFMARVVDLH